MQIEIDPGSASAPYEQIRDRIVEVIRSGALPPGARLPTVRALAADLGLAVNTVAKAYRQLEAEGHVATRGRNGTVVLHREGEAEDDAALAAVTLARTARARGLDLDETVGLLRRLW